MGLDVFLHRCADRAAAKARKAEYEAATEKIYAEYPEYTEMTKAQQDEVHARCLAVAKSLGLGEWGEDPTDTEVRLPSAKYPDHLFKVGYFRSSYNNSEIDRILRQAGIPDLGAIFEAHEQCEFTPDWEKARERALSSLARLKAYQESPEARFDCLHLGNLGCKDESPKNQAEALAMFLEHWRRWQEQSKDDFLGSEYANYFGLFSRDGLKVHAVLHGKQYFGEATYVVFERDPANLDWYVQALEIVVETCDYVLSQPDRDDHYLHWSS